MARRGRPASESYQSVCYTGSSTVSLTGGTEIVGLDEEDDQAPIFSLSKSSMDVVMVSGLPHKRDPVWARTDLRRSSSTNTHSEQNSVTLQQLHPQMWQHINATNSHQLAMPGQNVDMHGPPVLSERWITNMQRWSNCSASTHSRSSTPDTIVWKDGNSRPSSLIQVPACTAAPESPLLKSASSPNTLSPSPSITPVQTPTLTPSSQHLKEVSVTLNSPSPPPPPPPPQTESLSPLPSNSPILRNLPNTNSEGFLENNKLTFTFPSPNPSSVCIAEEGAPPEVGSIVDDVIERLQSPRGGPLPESGGARSPMQMLSPRRPGSCLSPDLSSPAGAQSSESGGMRSPVEMLSPMRPGSCHSQELSSPGAVQPSESELRSPVHMCGYLKPDFCPSPDLQSPGSAQLSESEVRSPAQMFGHLKLDFCPNLDPQSPGSAQISESGEIRSPVQMFGYPRPDFCPSMELQSPGSAQFSEVGEVRSPLKPGFCLSPELCSPGCMQLSDSGEMRSPVQMSSYLKLPSQAEQEAGKPSACHLELPWLPVQSFLAGRGGRLPLVSSLSDSQLDECCRCHFHMREGIAEALKEEGGATSLKPQLVDAAVQTISPIGYFWGLRRNTSNSNMGSHSLLGSPPGSRLNLKSSIGSNSNLVSPSSSMFPVSSEEEEERQEEDLAWEVDSPSMHNPERRRSCLKTQSEMRDQLCRRSSMKQVQWDEEGMTWDIHGAAVDPEELNSAIQKHLELKNNPQPAKRPSKKKKRAPKPPLISNVVKAMTPELNPPGIIISSACMVEPESEDLPETERGSDEVEKGTGRKEEAVEIPRRASRAEAAEAEQEEEVYGDESSSQAKSPSHVSGQSRKKSVIRSLRPGWCGGSRKTDG